MNKSEQKDERRDEGCFAEGCDQTPVEEKRVILDGCGYGVQPLCEEHAGMTPGEPVVRYDD